jgi:hypothetical protein
MAAFDVIDWPIALVIALGHEIGERARTRALRKLGEGIEAGGEMILAGAWEWTSSQRVR